MHHMYVIVIVFRLIDGTNVTNSDDHMWLIPFTAGEDHLLTITFPTVMQVTGLRLWNYNKSAEDTYRGVFTFNILFCIMK